MPSRYQRGGVFKVGNLWKGTFRIDTEGKRGQKKVTIGTVQELPTKCDARKKLTQIMGEYEKPGAVKPTKKLFSDLVERWKAARGPALGKSTFQHYSNALRAYVLPHFKDRPYLEITNEEIQTFINHQAKRYSPSVLKSTRLVLSFVLGWAKTQRELPDNPAKGVYLPREIGGRRVVRTELLPEQTLAIVTRLKEPYSTLVLLLASVGCRGEEAVGLKPSDLDAANVLHFRRVIYGGKAEPLEKEQHIPLDAVTHTDLIRRLRALGQGQEWMFRTRAGTPFSVLDNGRKRYLHAAAQAVGVRIGGWHDFRHTLNRKMRRAGVHPVVISGILGHKRVTLAAEVYDRATAADIGQALDLVGKQLLPQLLPADAVQ